MTNQPVKAVTCLAFLTAMLAFSSAHALSVIAEPEVDQVLIGDFIDVELRFDFDTLTVGGGVDITVSASGVLSFVEFTPSSDLLALDPAFTLFGTDLADGDYYVAPGDFNGFDSNNGPTGTADDGQLGVQTLGVITVQAVSEGIGIIDLEINTALGDFFPTSGTTPLVVELVDAEITVIPVPAAAWLFGSALALLAGVRRRIQAR